MTLLRTAAAAVLSLACLAPAHAQYPERPITIIVPFGPGGSSDLVARAISQKLGAELGQSVVVDNRPGATGAIGATALARAQPDGYTLMIASIGAFAINPALQPKLPYQPLRDFTLLTEAVRTPNVLVAHPGFEADTVEQLVAALKRRPGAISFATGGNGSSEHLNTELFWQQTGTQGIHVPYKGTGQAVTDMLAGHANVGFLNLSSVSQHIRNGGLKALAITSDHRSELLPDTPTVGQAGLAGTEVYSWQGIAAPKGLPPQITETLHAALVKTLRDPQVSAALVANGFDVVASPRDVFERFVTEEIDRWQRVARTANLVME